MSTSSTYSQRRRILSIIALNNVGVRLLERQCYAQAVDSLKQGLSLLRGGSEGSTTKKNSVVEGGEDRVNRCLHHLSCPRPARKQVLLLEVLTETQEGLQCGDASPALETILEGAPSSYVAFPIRMEGDSTKARKSILLHNLGIACYCSSKTTRTRPSIARRLGSTAWRISQWASQELQMELDRREKEGHPGLVDLFCLNMVALNSLIQAQPEAQDAAYGLLVQLRSKAMANAGSTHFSSVCQDQRKDCHSAAAAAA